MERDLVTRRARRSLLRWRWLLVPAALAASTLGSSSCIQIGPNDEEGGAGADADTDATGTSTAEQQCNRIVAAYCARAQGCYGQDPELCLQSGVDNCCGRYCAKPATSSEKRVDVCVSDVKSASCDVIDVGQLPDSCLGVVTW